MKARSGFAIAKQLIRDTFRQSSASGISGMMLAVTSLCVLLCLSVSVTGDLSLQDDDEPVFFLPPPSLRAVTPGVAAPEKNWTPLVVSPDRARHEGVETVSGKMTLAFGAVSVPLGRDRRDAVGFLELVLGWGVAGTFGLLMALIWTAGFVPAFLDPSAAAVLLAKPARRWQLLLGKYVSVVTFVGFHVVLFVVSTWLALGVRTRVWDPTYLGCIPVLLVQFAIFYSFSVLLAVVTRSAAACVFGSALFWVLAWGINYGSVMASGMPENQYLPTITLALAQLAYWIFPKPIDAGLILYSALDAHHHFDKPVVFKLLESGPGFSPLLSIVSSLLITALLLVLSAHQLEATDY